jgi:methyl-accepting chemotaxis protein
MKKENSSSLQKKFKSSLFIKIFVPALLFIMVPSIINLIYAAYSASNALETESGNSLSRLTLEKKNEVDLVFQAQFSLLDTWIRESSTVDFFRELDRTGQMDPARAQQLTKDLEDRFQKADGLYENIFFTYEDRVWFDGIGGASVGYVMDPVLEDYYYAQLENPGLATGHYMYSPITGRPTIPIIDSILDGRSERVISAMVIAIDVNRLTENLVKSGEGQTMGTMILDAQGLVIAADQAELALQLNFSKQDGLQPFFTKMEESASGIGIFTLNGLEYIASYAKHDRYEFYILTYMPIAQYMDKVNMLRWNISIVILVCVILSGIALFFSIRSIVKPIKMVAGTARRIAEGDLTVEQVRLQRSDEIGELAHSFNTMLNRLKEMVEQIGLTSKQVAASAGEFSAAAGRSSDISRQVAETVREVSAGTDVQSRHISHSVEQIRDITNGVRNIADNTQTVTSMANLASEKADAGMATVSTSLSEIGTANETIHRVSDQIRNLGERSKEISQIVDLITQIADQTHLLALNASIEAAKAGEDGRGFEVVAHEIRKLADQAKESSDQIRTLIDSILNETEQTVCSMDEAVQQSAKGLEAIRSVERTFHDIQTSVKEATAQIEEVAAATQQMSAAIEQIAANMHEISDISAKTAEQTLLMSGAMEKELASAQEIAASSREMDKLAKQLQAVVQQFKIGR